jgi:hypothetical protein
MWAFLVALWPGVLKVQGIDGRVEARGLGELVGAGELAARGTGELADPRGRTRVPRYLGDRLLEGSQPETARCIEREKTERDSAASERVASVSGAIE